MLHRDCAPRTKRSQCITRSPLGITICAAGCILAGCGSGNKPVTVNAAGGLASMPAAPAPSLANTYTGTESVGVWTVHLDDSAKTYTYADAAGGYAPASGGFVPVNGFLDLGPGSGYALEVPGRLALLRPGDVTAPLVVSVPQISCYSIPYFLRFQYIAMEASSGIAVAASSAGKDYGSVLASSSTDGSAWQYEGLSGTTAAGPSSFAGACSSTNGEATLSLPGTTFFNTAGAIAGESISGVQSSLTIGPSGILVAQQAGSTAETGASAVALTGVAGVAEPATPLQTARVISGTYLGFLTEAGEAAGPLPTATSPVSFGQLPGSATSLAGGAYPSDDVTAAANTDTTLTLGAPSSALNGFYPSASITKLDPNQLCYSDHPSGVGSNSAGYPTCTFPAIVVVGNPEGKYVLFVNAFDYTAGSLSGSLGTAMQMYLYQQ